MTDKQNSQDQKENYEEKIKKNSFPGLLGVFEERLRNRNKNLDEENSEEFPSVNITSASINSSVSGVPSEKVTDDQINSLLSKTPVKYESNFSESASKNTIVEETVSKHKYEDSHPTINNVATTEDTKVGYDPVNTKLKNESFEPSVNQNNPPSVDLSSTPYTQRGISDDEVMKHIMKHRKEKAQQVKPEQTDAE